MRVTWIQVVLIVLGAAGLGALLVTGADWRKPDRQTTMRALAGAVLAAILAVAFATGENGTPVSFVTEDGSEALVQEGERAAETSGAGVTPERSAGPVTSGGDGGGTFGPTTGRTPGASAPGIPAPSPVDPNLPTLKIGYIGLDPSSATGVISAFVPNYPIPEDPEVYAKTVEDWVNTHGGVNGHRIEIITKTRDPQSSNPNQLLDICKELTEGDKVFAVAGTDSDTDADLCYAQHRVPFICDCGFETTSLKKNAPWLWAPGSVDSATVQVTMVTSLGEQGYFAKGTKLGILVRDAPEQWDLYRKRLLPIIKRFNNYATDDIDAYPIRDTESTADYGEYTSDIQAAVTRFKLAGINRVFFLYGGDLIALYFMDQAESQRYYPRYGLESSAHTYLTLQANVPQSQLHDSIGVGYQMIVDVDEANGDPYPATGETECFAAFKAKGNPPPDRVQAVYPQQLCDPVFMFKEAAKGLGPNFTASAWTKAADQLGTRFQAGVGLPGATRFIPGRYVGIGRYRVLKYVDSCPGDPDANPGGGCYKYASKNLDMPI